MMKKTKIVATIGPASDSKEVLEELFKQGVNVCRLNFSHGNHVEHQARMDRIKKIREDLGMPIAIMLDTKGPEIRLGDFKEELVEIKQGQEFTLTTRDILGDETIVSVTYKDMPKDIQVNSIILIDDGLVEFRVKAKTETDILMEALNGGILKKQKGVNIPNVNLSLPVLTDKDILDIKFGIENQIDFIAASFVRKAEDVNDIRRIVEENSGFKIDIISKIENQQGLDNIDEIINVSDGIMVARGDLGVEVPTEQMPLIQKELIRKCNKAGKPVITATQMLDSMMRNPRPTRAEVTDVANAIIDGSSAVMLSGETAVGKYPIESVKTMYNIAINTENSLDYKELLKLRSLSSEITTTNAISKATVNTASDLGAKAIITATSSGYTSKAISKFRPKAPIIAATTKKSVMRKLALEWGVYPVLTSNSNSTDEVIELSIKATLEAGYVDEGDLVVVTAGIPVGLSGTTNLIKVHTIGKILMKGTGIGNGVGKGSITIGDSEKELLSKFEDGDILVTKCTHKDIVKFAERAGGIITEEGGLTSHGAIVGISLNKPTIVGVEGATKILIEGDIVTVDSTTGQIYKGNAKVL